MTGMPERALSPLPAPALYWGDWKSRDTDEPRVTRVTEEHFLRSIFSRTRDIIAANIADLLDRADEPAKMIRMMILEMEETLVDARASAARHIADQKEMRRQIAKLDQVQDGWLEKAELALSKGREDLAKAALVEKQKAKDLVEQLQESANNRTRLREMYAGPKTEDAFSRFEVLERRVDLAEGRADAAGFGIEKSLEEEIAELRSAEKVDAELEALKARAQARSSGQEG